MSLLIPIQLTQPAFASVDPDTGAAFVPGEFFNARDQAQPARHAVAGARGDHAHFARVGPLQPRRGGSENCGLAPLNPYGEPKQRAAAENIALDIAKRREARSRDRAAEQRLGKRPDLVNPCGIDADQFSRGWRRRTLGQPSRCLRA